MMRRSFLLLLVTIPLATFAQEKKTWRIMPLGDSITEGGKTFSVYREPLLVKLKEAGYAIRYVGSKKSASPSGPIEHEGYGGRNAEFLASIIDKSFTQHPADIVLIHAGHNHFVEEKPVPRIVKATESIIASLRKTNPTVIVFVAQVIPSGKLPKYAYITPLNEELAKLAARLNQKESPVIIVNQAEGFDPEKDTIADKVHPNEKGAAKMADKWFEAIVQVISKNQ